MTIFYAYWLGLFMIGPFTTLGACQEAHRYQLAWGTKEEVSECWTIVDARTTFSVTSPTYQAPLTISEVNKRAQNPSVPPR